MGHLYHVEGETPFNEIWSREDPEGRTDQGTGRSAGTNGARLRMVSIKDPDDLTGGVLAPVFCPESSDQSDIDAVEANVMCRGNPITPILVDNFQEMIDCVGYELTMEFDSLGHLYRVYVDYSNENTEDGQESSLDGTFDPVWCRDAAPDNTVGVLVRIILSRQLESIADDCCTTDSIEPLTPEVDHSHQIVWIRFDALGHLTTVYFEKVVDCCGGSDLSSMGGVCCDIDLELQARLFADGTEIGCFTGTGDLTQVDSQRWIGEIHTACDCTEEPDPTLIAYEACWEVDVLCDDDGLGGDCTAHRLILRTYMSSSSDCETGQFASYTTPITTNCKCDCDSSDSGLESIDEESIDSSDECFFLEYDIPVAQYLTAFPGCGPTTLTLRIEPR